MKVSVPPPRTVIVGVGNPLMGDDAAGLETARLLAALAPPGTEHRESEAGGLELVDLLEGFDRAVIVDAMAFGEGEVGEVAEVEFALPRRPDERTFSHAVGLAEGIEICRRMGLKMPDTVRVFAVFVRPPFSFGAPMSKALKEKLRPAAESIARAVFGPVESCTKPR